MPDADPSRYVRGPTYARRARPRFEFKPSSTGYTGGGYARIRSTEYREHTPGDGADDVFVSVHRLAAVAWHLPDGDLGTDVFLSELDGCDVHHTQPDAEARGMPAANGEGWTTVESHADHSKITQAEMRAYGADAKRAADGGDGVVSPSGVGGCPECGGEVDGDGATVGEREGLCLDCAADVAAGTDATIEL
jgi:hypothetical protein